MPRQKRHKRRKKSKHDSQEVRPKLSDETIERSIKSFGNLVRSVSSIAKRSVSDLQPKVEVNTEGLSKEGTPKKGRDSLPPFLRSNLIGEAVNGQSP